jgi:hypothetical protein
MNEIPPTEDQPDDIDDHYRRASALDPSRPSVSVRRAVMGHAAQLAAERASKPVALKIDMTRPAANQAWRRPAITGTLAAAALAGLLIAPRFLTAPAPSGAPSPHAQASPPELDSSLGKAAPAAEEPAPSRAASARAAPEFKSLNRQAATAGMPPPRTPSDYTELQENRQAADSRAAGGAKNAAAASGAAEIAEPPTQRVTVSASRIPAPAVPRSAAVPQAMRPLDASAALRRAAESGDVAAMRSLLGHTIDIEARDASGRTALMLATMRGQSLAVDALLENGADPNAADARGTTPLQAALAGDQRAIVAALKRAGAR